MTDDLEQRLRRLGDVPLDPETTRAHQAAMAAADSPPGPAPGRFGWKAVAAAAIAAFLAGSTGLAAAGALPDPAQDAAHDVLDVVGIGVPRSTEDCPEGTSYRNHGEYVSAVEAAGGDVEAAAHSDCGKPSHPGKGGGKGADDDGRAPRADADGDPCTGPPPWAGSHLGPEEREAAKAERRAACGTDEDDAREAAEDGAEADAEAEERDRPVGETTTTTVVETTTTTTVVETTTTSVPGS